MVARYIRIVEVRSSNLLCSTTSPSENTVFGRIFYTIHTKFTHSKPEIAKKGGVSPSDFRDFSDFWYSDAAVAIDEFLNAAAEGDGSSDVVAQCREHEFGGDFFLAPAEKMAAVGVMLPSAVSRILDRRGALIVKCRRSIL